MQATIERELPPDARAAGLARRAVGEVPGIDDEVVGDLRLLVTELVTNSVRHADGGNGDRLILRIYPGATVRVEVWDAGPGFAPSSPGRPTASATSGWGLFLVDCLSARWGVEVTRGTCVWAEIDLP